MAKQFERVGRELTMRELEAVRGGGGRPLSAREQAMLRRRWLAPRVEQGSGEETRKRKRA